MGRRAAARRARRRRLGFGAGSSGSRARGGWTPERRHRPAAGRRAGARRACSPPTSTSPAPGVDRLLFGTLIGLSDARRLADRGRVVAASSALDAALAADVAGHRLRPGQRPRARRAHGARPTALLLVAVAVAVVVVARRRRRAARGRRARRPRRDRAAGRARRARAAARDRSRSRPPRASPALLARRRARRRPRPGDGGARRRRVRARRGGAWRRFAAEARACRVRVTGSAGGYAPGRDALADVSFALRGRPDRRRSSAPTAAARRRCSARCSASCRVRRGTVELAGRPAYVPQTDRARLDFPVSALDVALMGAYGRTPFYRRLGRADREAARRALERVGLADRARTRFGDALRRPAPARADRPRARPGRPRAAARRAAVAASTRRAPRGSRRCSRELRDEGRALLVATHDVEQARASTRVLCLHRRQVAFGAPAEVLTARRAAGRPTATSWWCSTAAGAPSTSTTTTH